MASERWPRSRTRFKYNSEAALIKGDEASRVFESSCVAFNLRKSSQIVSQIYAKEMADAPINGPLFSLLASINKLGPRTITAVAEDVGLDRTTLTRNSQQLTKRGFVQVVRLLRTGKRFGFCQQDRPHSARGSRS